MLYSFFDDIEITDEEGGKLENSFAYDTSRIQQSPTMHVVQH